MSAPIDHLDASPSEAVRRHAATFRKVREARRAAAVSESSDELVHRAPRVPAREARSDEVPRPAASVAKLAKAHGWAVRVTYAEGPVSDEGSAVSSVMLVAQSPDRARRAMAMWRRPSDKWALAWCLLADIERGLRKVGARELKAALAGESSDEKSRVATDSPMT